MKLLNQFILGKLVASVCLFLAFSSQALAKEPSITLKTVKGDLVQVERAEIMDALKKQYTGAHFDERSVNSDGSITFTNPTFMFQGHLAPLYGEEISERDGKRETEKGYCKLVENLAYQTRTHENSSRPVVVLDEDGKFLYFYPLQFSGIVSSVTCKKSF